MYKDQYARLVQTSVTIFIHHRDDYLFVKRAPHKRIDPGRLNGVGGKLEKGEDFLTAAVRETEEETGYKADPSDFKLVTIGKLEGGYDEDWIMCNFTLSVEEKKIPHGMKTAEGEFQWIHKDAVLDSGYELVDDLHYIFKDITSNKYVAFFSAQLNEKEKIENISISRLPRGGGR